MSYPSDESRSFPNARGTGRQSAGMEEVSHTERLVEALIPEALGLETPPDIAVAVRQAAVRQVWIRKIQTFTTAAVLFFALGVIAWTLMSAGGNDPRNGSTPGGGGGVAVGPTTGPSKSRQVPGAYPGPDYGPELVCLNGDSTSRGSVFGTEDKEAVLLIGGYAKFKLLAWTTIRWTGSDYKEAVEILEGGLRCQLDAAALAGVPNGVEPTVEITTIHGTTKVRPGSAAFVWLQGKFYDREPECTLFAASDGAITVKGKWGAETLTKAAKYFYPTGPVGWSEGRHMLFPKCADLGMGEVTHVGPMDWGPSGWTIRTAEGIAYCVMKEPDFVGQAGGGESRPDRFKIGWVYKVTWVDGQLKSAEPLHPNATKYR